MNTYIYLRTYKMTALCTNCAFMCCSYIKVNLATVVEGNQKVLFSIATTPRCRGEGYSFPKIAPFYP